MVKRQDVRIIRQMGWLIGVVIGAIWLFAVGMSGSDWLISASCLIAIGLMTEGYIVLRLRRKLAQLRRARRVLVDEEKLALEEDGRFVQVMRLDVSNVQEWPNRGIVIDTTMRKGALTIPIDVENYDQVRNVLLNWQLKVPS